VDHPPGNYVLQSVFTTTKWCRRRLTRKEVATAFDVPSTAFDVPYQVVEPCTVVELDLLPKYPSRTLEHCAKSLLAHEGLLDRGGISIPSKADIKANKDDQTIESRVCEDTIAGVEEGAGEHKVRAATTAPLGLKPPSEPPPKEKGNLTGT
jgi:hypothetical protein